jgi:uncharacterized protein
MTYRFSAGQTDSKTTVEYSWWLYAENSENVAWAGETFPSLFNAQRAAREFKSGAASANFETYLDDGQKYRWRAWRSSDKVAASGESFYGKFEADRAAQNVRRQAGLATGP